MTENPDETTLYLLQDAYSEDTLRFLAIGWAEEAPIEFLFALGRGEAEPPTPLRLEPGLGGDEEADWLWGEPSAIMVISEGLRSRLKQAGVTGWSVYPVDVRDADGRSLKGYHGLAVTGRAGPRDTKQGRLVTYSLDGTPETDYQVRRGFFFDQSAWDGSDMFMLAGSLWLLATDKARRVLEQADTRDLNLVPLADVEIDAAL